MKMNRRQVRRTGLFALAILMTAVTAHTAFSQRIAVIVNPDVQVLTIDPGSLLNIYSLNMQSWKDGSRITLFTLQGNQKLVQQFHRFIGRSPLELRKIWLRFQLSGEGRSPSVLASEAEMVEHVAAQPGAIGFVSADALKPDVKVIAWID
jgi:hypothetical protein